MSSGAAIICKFIQINSSDLSRLVHLISPGSPPSLTYRAELWPQTQFMLHVAFFNSSVLGHFKAVVLCDAWDVMDFAQ